MCIQSFSDRQTLHDAADLNIISSGFNVIQNNPKIAFNIRSRLVENTY